MDEVLCTVWLDDVCLDDISTVERALRLAEIWPTQVIIEARDGENRVLLFNGPAEFSSGVIPE